MEVVASLSQGRTAAAQCGLFTHKSVPVVFEPPSTTHCDHVGDSMLASYYGGPRFIACLRNQLLEVFCSFPQSLQANARVVPQIRQ